MGVVVIVLAVVAFVVVVVILDAAVEFVKGFEDVIGRTKSSSQAKSPPVVGGTKSCILNQKERKKEGSL